jgi:Undecaprenyl-phosphate glucose phosphotransferase
MSNTAHVLGHRSAAELSFIRRFSRRLTLPFYLLEPAVLAVEVLLIITTSVASGIGYHWIYLNRVPNAAPYLTLGVLIAFNFSAIQLALRAYSIQSLLNYKRGMCHVVFALWSTVLILVGVGFSLKIGADFSRGAAFGFMAVATIVLVAWRRGLAILIKQAHTEGGFAQQRTLVIGEGSALSHSPFVSRLRSSGYEISAQLEIDDVRRDPNGDRLRTTLQKAVRLAREEQFDAVVLFVDWQNKACIDAVVSALGVLPMPVYLIPDERVATYLTNVCSIGDVWTAELKRAPLTKREQAVKRLIDIVGAVLGILILCPLMLAVAVLIKAESSGPVIFRQHRSGFNGRVFKIFKFRTMTVLEDGPNVRQASRDDKRFTRVGRWLRRTNIDELPQLFNVLFGEMSLVGPRPHAVAHDCEYERQIATYAFRQNVKPGISGWAQYNGYRGETRSLDLMLKRVECDLWYINHWNVWLDLKIILGTVLSEAWRARGY